MIDLRTWRPAPMEWALLFSVLLHAVLITAVGFVKPELKQEQDKSSVMDIVLVNAKTKEKPKKADVLAQSSLDRGGNTDKDRRMKTPLPPPKKRIKEPAQKPAVEAHQSKRTKAASAQSEAPKQPQRTTEQEKQVQEVMTQADSPQIVDNQPAQQAQALDPEQGEEAESPTRIDTAELVARSLDAARLEAIISKNMDDYQKRPKRKFIGARAKEYRFAAYVEAWRQKVERVGNLNYPEAAKAQKLYGQLRMTVSIRADGSIEKIELNKSSGHKILDQAARRIVELAAPFAEFPEDIRKDTDIIGITRTWTFTREDTLASGD